MLRQIMWELFGLVVMVGTSFLIFLGVPLILSRLVGDVPHPLVGHAIGWITAVAAIVGSY